MILKQRIAKDFYFAIGLVALSRFVFFLASEIWNELHNIDISLFDLLCQWDAGWYAGIVEQGYMKEPTAHPKSDAANWAFFPLYPMVVRLFAWLTGLNVNYSGVLLSTIFLVFALFFLSRYISITRDDSTACLAAILVAFGPYSFYFSSLYTESLFVLLVAICFYFLQKENWVLCGIFGAFLSATRPIGVVFFFPLLLKLSMPYLATRKNFFYALKSIIVDEKKLLSLLLVPAGLFAYMTFLYFWVGDPFAFKHIQLAWGRVSGNPFEVLFNGLMGHGAFGGLQSRYLALWGLVGLLCSGYLFVQNRYFEASFGLICLVIPMMSSVQSLPRYFVGSLVLVFALNDIINNFGRFKWPMIVASGAINILLLFLWFAGHEIST